LVLPNIDAANISYNLLKTAAGGNIAMARCCWAPTSRCIILTPTATVRRIVNMTVSHGGDANAAR
jgi:malate dehydrogenase (oxaloacetate-decarboxylating)(NADP+)